MRCKISTLFFVLCIMPLALLAQENVEQSAPPVKLLVLITEQNIGGPQRAWWASEIDLSIVESALAGPLLESGYQVIDPGSLRDTLDNEPAYREVRMRQCHMTDLANLQGAQYIIKGTAIASPGTKVPQSGLVSYYARVSARLIRVKDRMQVGVFNVTGKSAHSDAVGGGSEALEDAGRRLAKEVVRSLKREGVR